MKRILTTLILVTLLFPTFAFGETMDDLVERNGIYYKKFSTVPFTGKVTGQNQGAFKNGKKHGPWVQYWSNGQLNVKGTYKNGEQVGPFPWIDYHSNGDLMFSN